MIEHLLEPDFAGHVGRTVDESVPWWPSPPEGEGRPNVVMVVLDDVGFGQLGCYGSDVRTPAIDGLAAGGVRFNNFHVTPLCSPTRACLLTGRNHHSVGMNMISGFPSGFPNGRERVSRRAAMLPNHLRAVGYSTYAIGKWHLGPMHQITPAGPFDQWPLAHGFDRFYGFLAGETDQYRPNLVVDNHFVEPASSDTYHLSEDLTDAAVAMVTSHRSAAPQRPFFLYLAYGACHGPFQVPEPFRSGYAGAFDDGWDAARARCFERQLAAGVIPPGTTLPPANPGLTSWEDVPNDDRRVFARLQELFAGFLEHTDVQVGRLLASLEALECRDDTVVVVLSDNGAAGEGGTTGSWNELIPLNGQAVTAAESAARLDVLGGPETYPVYPTAWAQAGNTPCKWYKSHTFGGGVRAPLVLNWPGGGERAGAMESGFCHVVDIVPTLLELCDVHPLREVAGVEQMPLHGRSLAPVILHGAAVASPPRTQYFEMGGHRGIYHDGWKATTFHRPGASFHDETWELYHLEQDFSESRNLAEEHPELLRQLVELWWLEAGKYGVTPLGDRFLELALAREGQPNADRRRFAFHRGTVRIGEAALPSLHGGTYRVRVELLAPAPADQGVLVAYGGRFAGWVLHVTAGELVFEHRGLRRRAAVSAPLPDAPGAELFVGFDRKTSEDGAVVSLVMGDRVVAQVEFDDAAPYYCGGNGLEIGRNGLSPVSDSYGIPYDFTGTFRAVNIELDPDADLDRAEAAAAALRAD